MRCASYRSVRVLLHATEALRRGRAGFTLIEAICTLAIAAVVMAVLFTTLSTTLRGYIGTREALRRVRLASGIERVLRRDFAAAYRGNEKGMVAFVGRPEGSLGGEPSLEFFSTNSFAPAGAASVTGLSRIEYVVRPSERVDGGYQLFRRETPCTPGKAVDTSRSSLERLADGLASWRPGFYDGREWRDRWQRERLPQTVRVEFAIQEEDGTTPETHVFLFASVASPDADPTPSKVQ